MSENELPTISAKKLGNLAQPDCCERCFWVRHIVLKSKIPWAIPMPIYGVLDRAQKAFVEDMISNDATPEWLSELGTITKYIDPPYYKNFYFINPEHQVRVWGNADLILIRDNGELVIVDLKTANAKCGEDALAMTYVVQNTCYSMAAEARKLGTVGDVALVYMTAQPKSLPDLKPPPSSDFQMVIPFKSTVYIQQRDSDLVNRLCGRFRELHDMTESPAGRSGCKDCEALDKAMEALTSGYTRATAAPQKPSTIGFTAEDYRRAFPAE